MIDPDIIKYQLKRLLTDCIEYSNYDGAIELINNYRAGGGFTEFNINHAILLSEFEVPQCDKMKTKLRSATRQIRQLQWNLTNTTSSLSLEKEVLSKTNSVAKSKIDSLTHENVTLKSEIRSLNDELLSLKFENSTLTLEIIFLESNSKPISYYKNPCNVILKRKIDRINDEKLTLKKRIVNLTKGYSTLELENLSLKFKNRSKCGLCYGYFWLIVLIFILLDIVLNPVQKVNNI